MRVVGCPDLRVLDAAPVGRLSRVDLEQARILEAVVRQALAHPARPRIDVVPMDEFTHDVVIALQDDLVLVFDTT